MRGDGALYWLHNETTGKVIARRARLAESLWEQFIGLMGRADIAPDEALGIPGCAAIHTFFVRVPLDAAFCDRDGRVLRLMRNIAPFHITSRVSGASMVWEMRAGGALGADVSVGDALALKAAAGRE